MVAPVAADRPHVILASAGDGAALCKVARKALKAAEPSIVITEGTSRIPEPWESVAVVFVLSKDALADRRLTNYASSVVKRQIPLVPLTKVVAKYDFKTIPADLTWLSTRNAVGISGTGPKLVETIRGYLGLESFAKDQKVFISYRRTDGSAIADKVYEHLWKERFTTFRDTLGLEGGAVVQESIYREISDKDFVLLIDTPEAAKSEWVMAEVIEALARRVPIGVIRTQDRILTPLAETMPSERWQASDPHRLQRIHALVSRGIGAKASLDGRVQRTVSRAAQIKGLDVRPCEPPEPRRLILSRGSSKVLVEYENTTISLERLHRLYNGYRTARPCARALFICGDKHPPDPTKEAVVWARRRTPLSVGPLPELYSFLDDAFPGGRP